MKTIEFDFDNVGGIARIFAIPVASFLCIRKDYMSDKNYLELQQQDNIIDIPVRADNSFSFSEIQSREEGGELFAVEIKGIIPKLCAFNDKYVRTLERGEWLVLHQDNNGTIQLSGSKEVPLRFTSDKSTGDSAAARNGNSFTFSASEPEPSVIIDLSDIPLI